MRLTRLIFGRQTNTAPESDRGKQAADAGEASEQVAAAARREKQAEAQRRRAEKAAAAEAARREKRAEAQRRRAEKAAAFEVKYGADSAFLGVVPTAEAFECVECGRWAPVPATAVVARRLVAGELHLNEREWGRMPRGKFTAPVRASFLQRQLKRGYEESVETLEAGVCLGLLDQLREGVIVSSPRCAECYERRAAASQSPSPGSRRDPIPPQVRFKVLQRDAFRCQYCGRSARDGTTLHLDHVVPLAAGGPTTEDNLITACDECNVGKSATRLAGT